MDAVIGDAGRYMLIRSVRPGHRRPYAAVFIRRNEVPEKVAEQMKAEILEIAEDWKPETAERLEKERDRLNSVSEVMTT